MRWLAPLAVVLVAFGCTADPARTEQTTQAETGRLTYEDLVALIQAEHVTSLEQLLPKLPEDLRSNYVLMHDSRSLQGASYDAPRVILFGTDARLTCAVAGDSGLPGFDALECFQFREAERTFDFRQIRFPTKENGLTEVAFSASNQTTDGRTQCTSCHGRDPRPNWDGYSTWPGAYGSDDDTLESDASRYAGFVARRGADPRYRWLIQGTKPNDPYMDDETVDIGHRPNIRFSDASGRMNAFRAVRLLTKHVSHARALAFAVSALGCRLTDEQRSRLTAAGIDPTRELDLGAIFAETGVSSSDWGTQIFDDPPETSAPWEHQSGFSLLSMDVAMTIAQDEARAGNAALQTGLDHVAAYTKATYTGPELVFFSALDALVPDPDYFGGSWEDNTAAVCPALADAYVTAALVH
jgi:hypothetical protein